MIPALMVAPAFRRSPPSVRRDGVCGAIPPLARTIPPSTGMDMPSMRPAAHEVAPRQAARYELVDDVFLDRSLSPAEIVERWSSRSMSI